MIIKENHGEHAEGSPVEERTWRVTARCDRVKALHHVGFRVNNKRPM